MFGDKLMVGIKTVKVDAKGRVCLPNFTESEKDDYLVLETLKENDDIILRFSLYDEYLKLAERLNILRNNATSIKEFEKYSQEIENICLKVSCAAKIDAQRRFLVPSEILEENHINKGDELVAKGAGKSLIMQKKK